MPRSWRPGRAAMCREDLPDSRRGHPAGSLLDYAAHRGLVLHDGVPIAGFEHAQPRFLEEQHEAVHGVLPGGREGVLLHRLVQTHVGEGSPGFGIPGTYHGVLVKSPRGSLRKALTPNRTWIPFIGQFLDDGIEQTEVPFGTTGAWSPMTTCAVAAPELDALGVLHLRSRARCPRMRVTGFRDVNQLKVLRAEGDPAAVQAALDGPARAVLSRLTGPFRDVRVADGLLVVTRNGYLEDGAALDAFAQETCALAGALARTAVPAPA